mmetsp:Transcript_4230/g.8087  ORF Transcript_4230/g.8087 Transcript_4230/m.8087 type:complete len:276 (-) Transcript_4230:1406-2233(-)
MYIITIQLKTAVFACMTLLIGIFILYYVALANLKTASSSSSSDPFSLKISYSTVQLTLPFGTGSDNKSLNYVHCGNIFTRSTITDKDIEILLLHGAKYSKDDWAHSGILNELCLEGGTHISVTALDLSVASHGDGFRDAFDALVQGEVLCGKPVVVVSPSASGKAIVSLANRAEIQGDISDLKHMIKTWIPVASPSVLAVKDDSVLENFSRAVIPIVSIHGDQDVMGKKVTAKLVQTAGAKGVELKGGHAVYLDSPHDFVQVIIHLWNSGNQQQL